MKAKSLVVANWKMNKSYVPGIMLLNQIISTLDPLPEGKEMVICPPYIHLQTAQTLAKDRFDVYIGAQNCHVQKEGAYTGEISAPMLADLGIKYVILGHSERRRDFAEDGKMLTEKVKQALRQGLQPIYCFGEPWPVRKEGQAQAFVEQQLQEVLGQLDAQQMERIVLAYEPIWAIGTGQTASPAEAEEMHAFIRAYLAKQFSEDLAQKTTILYGGSCKPSNAAALFAQPNINGALVGGASLDAEDFLAIVEAGRKEL
ncbi:triose-phosphate isomerase [Saprospira grandis]|uniref:Triosephosphate isomerase n=1 Tax=Saprospira grandis (strain Lewin) TaxID=984262 RepID=H6KZE4_SAPGL|nr:triose-phosphate isomerase [Saprospira grandis]AFC25720.1 triosephosphate isomerase [Saprospira grandis str. Lewin]